MAICAEYRGRRSYSVRAAAGAGLDLSAASRGILAVCLAVTDGLAPVIDRIDDELRAHFIP